MPKYKQYSPILASNFEQKDKKTRRHTTSRTGRVTMVVI